MHQHLPRAVVRKQVSPGRERLLDEERARDWVVVRMVLNAGWTVQDARRAGRRLSADEQGWVTRCIAITKAVQD